MKKAQVIKKLEEKYPGKNIVLNNQENPTEIIAEIDPENGKAIVVIDKSIAHFHKHTHERYLILKGELDIFINGKSHHLRKGDIFDIKPGEVHYAVGDETWIEETSNPPWSPKDHILDE